MSTSSSATSAIPTRTSPTLEKDERLKRAWLRGATPPPRITVPDWADRFRRKAKEAGSTSGKWRTSDVEISRGPMLAVTEPGVATLTVMVCTQLLKTALIENAFGFFAHLDPSPMLMLQPKEDAAEQFSKERITPLIRATPVLRELVGTRKTRNPDETLRYKAFPGGFLAIEGAGSPLSSSATSSGTRRSTKPATWSSIGRRRRASIARAAAAPGRKPSGSRRSRRLAGIRRSHFDAAATG